MSCVKVTDTIKEFASNFQGESPQTIANLLGIWWEENPDKIEELPSISEFKAYIEEVRSKDEEEIARDLAPTNTTPATITYIPKGKSEQTYTIKGAHIYNKNGKEVFKTDSTDRFAIFAKLAVKQKRAVIVEHKGDKYIVNNRNQILSVRTKKVMKWGEENGDRRDILKLASEKFNQINPQPQERNTTSVTKIISGGQTGVDTIGLRVAASLGIKTGGTAPKGFLREKNYDDEDITKYGLVEISDEAQAEYTRRTGKKDAFTGRTALNVINSDGTVYFGTAEDSAGEIATRREAEHYNKPFLKNPTPSQLRQWIADNNIKTLNIAGNRGSKLPSNNRVESVIRQALTGNINSKPVSQPRAVAPINIYFGSGENTHLSNFAVRPFTITNVGENPDAPIDGTFRTVEGAFQAQKLAYSSISEQEKESIRKQLETASGAEARRIGRTIKGLDTERWDELSSGLMHNIILASFQQNPQALQQLLATGNAPLTHTQDKGKWGQEFPRILMNVRAELRGTEQTPNISTVYNISPTSVESYDGNWTREEVEKDSNSLYIFTDNTDRDSGSNLIDPSSKYAEKYGKDKHYPTITQAVIRGLDNAMPLSTQRWYHKGAKGASGRWTDEDFEEFKKVIDAEIEDIEKEWNTGKYKRVVISGNGFFNTRISNISMERTPLIYQYLQRKLAQIGIISEDSASQMLDDALLDIPEHTAEDLPSKEKQEVVIDENPFKTMPVATTAQQRDVDLAYDPIVRRDRVTMLSRLFSTEVDIALEREKEILENRIMEENLSEFDRDALRSDLNSLTRASIISLLTPAGIFNNIRKSFQSYVDSSEEERIQSELAAIENNPDYDDYSKEEKLEGAKRRAAYNYSEYKKLLDHFTALAEEASRSLLITEQLDIDLTSKDEDEDFGEDSDSGNATTNNEESAKDGWMTNFRHISSKDSLSQKTRAAIRDMVKLDFEGYAEMDDLGNIRYYDTDYVHAVLIDKLKDMITSEDMIPTLKELAKLKPWVTQIIDAIENDEVLFSQFYQDFRKDFVQYWVQKRKVNPDGTVTYETFPINKPEGTYYLIDSWRDNYESGTLLDHDSIYNKTGEIDKNNAAKGLKIQGILNDAFQNKTTAQRLQLLENPDIWDNILKMLKMIGVDPNPAILRTALTNIEEGSLGLEPIMKLLNQLNIIFSGIEEGKVKSDDSKRGDLINTFGSAYNEIATIISDVTEDAIESSVRELGKSYYSHVNPSYLGKLIKQLKNIRGDEEKFRKFLEDEFGQYEWFKDQKTERWRNNWVELLANDKKARDILQHKVVLHYDKIPYTKWDDLDYTLVLLNEYWADPKGSTAWYHIPILADAPSAEFVKFVRYRSGLDEEGRKISYKDIILEKMVDLVHQEYNRIMLVRERDAVIQAGNELKKVSPIANYDVKRDNEGNITSKGGAEFKFIPELNNYITKDGKKFLDKFEELKVGSSSKLKEFVIEVLEEIMEEGFESDFNDWVEMGLLDEENGKFKYLPSDRFTGGQTASNKKVIEALQKAKDLLGKEFTPEMNAILNRLKDNKAINDKQAQKVFDTIKSLLKEKALGEKINNRDALTVINNLKIKNFVKEALREYYYNSKFATSQIIQLTATDLALYKNMEDFQKRFKEVHAPSLRLNTMATFHGEKVGRTWERTIYIKDDKIMSTVAKDIEKIFLDRNKRGEISDFDAASIIAKYGLSNETGKDGKKYYRVGKYLAETQKVNVADAQAYRSLSSYRAMMVMSGQWTDEMEIAYEHLKSPDGKWTMADFNIIWQTKKPFVYSQVNKDSGVDGHTGIKVGVQHKNSEFLLLALHDAVAGPLGKSGKLRAINDFMEKHNIDVVQFESAVKVGNQEPIDLSNINSYDDVIRTLGEATGIAYSTENPNVVHKVSYEDYGIQTLTPEHHLDTVQLIGTQIRKLITADMSDDIKITIDGKTLTKKEWLKLYNEINTENILQAFLEVDEIFKDKKKIEEVLLDEIKGDSRYGFDMIRACTLNEDGEFNIPLYDPIQSQRVQTLINSIIKKRITKQKIKGGALIQVSNYGLTDDLKIVFEGEGENKRIKYMECYMPAYSKEFYEAYMGEDGLLHIDDWVDSKGIKHKGLPEDLRKLIGYRTPTEDKYSMTPLYIKGFLPQQNGSAIMLPAEITTIAGSDFDVDKLYIMLPEFGVRYDYKRAIKDFEKSKGIMSSLASMFKEGSIFEDISNAPIEFKEWFKENKKNYGPIIYKLKYDYSKPAHQQKSYMEDNGRARRNNAIIDLMWGVLTNPDTAPKLLTPGGFEMQKSADRVMHILGTLTEEQLKNKGYTLNDLLTLPLYKLEELIKESGNKIDPLSPRTQVIFHQQNMIGNTMIGIYANHNASHALMQHTNLGVDPIYGSFTYANVKRLSLHSVRNNNGIIISRIPANFLAASVDNVKDNTLDRTNQNTFTGDTSMLLGRLGYTPTEIAILMRQPIVVKMTKKYFRESREGKSKETIIQEVIDKAAETANTPDMDWKNITNNNFDLYTLMKDIQLYKNRYSMSETEKQNYSRRQAEVGLLFQRVMKTADALSQVVHATRADTQNGGAGPTIADTLIKIQNVEDLIEAASSGTFPLSGTEVILDSIEYTKDVDELRQQLLNSPLPFLQAFYTLGVRMTERLLTPYFPHYTKQFREILDGRYAGDYEVFRGLRKMTKRGKLDVRTINMIYNDYLAFIMSKLEFFGDSKTKDGVFISAEEKRRAYINNFPAYFQKVVSENEDIAALDFIQRLKPRRANDKNPVTVLVFKNVGHLTSTLRERFTRDWLSLLHSSNPKAVELATQLFLYNYYRNGFAFGPATFIHLAPVALREIIPDYISTLRSLINEDNELAPERFIEQWVYNHLDNRAIVPEIPSDATTKFYDASSNKILDEITITIDRTASLGDKKAVISQVNIAGGNTIYDFHDFIARKDGKNFIYYRRDKTLTSDNSATYRRIKPLGYRNSFLEYEWDKTAEEMTSVLDKNIQEEDPIGKFAAQHMNPGTMEELGDAPSVSYIEDESYWRSLASVDALDEKADTTKDPFSTMTPNKNSRDANNEEICGAKATIIDTL